MIQRSMRLPDLPAVSTPSDILCGIDRDEPRSGLARRESIAEARGAFPCWPSFPPTAREAGECSHVVKYHDIAAKSQEPALLAGEAESKIRWKANGDNLLRSVAWSDVENEALILSPCALEVEDHLKRDA
jgi:hypothetical protein